MRTVPDLYRLIDSNIRNRKLFFEDIDELHDLTALFDVAGKAVSQVTLDTEARSLAVTGRLKFSSEEVDIRATLTQVGAMRKNLALAGRLRPELVFNIDGIDGIKLETLSVFFNTSLISFPDDSGMGDISITNGGLKGVIGLQKAKLTANLDFPNGDNTLWILNAALVSNGGASIEILSDLSGDDSWINLVPDDLRAQFSLQSLDLKVKFDRRQKTVPLLFVTTGLKPSIDLLNNGMAPLEDFNLFFAIRNATDPEKRRVYGAAKASFTLLDARFQVAGKLPELYLTGNLTPEKPLYLTELLAAHAPEYSDVLKQTGRDIMLHALSLRLDVPNKTFWLYAQSHMDWEIVPGKLALTAPQVNLVIAAQRAEAAVTVCFDIDSVNRVILNATFQRDRTLRFFGNIEQISAGSLLTGLANQLGLQNEFSPVLSAIALKDIQVSLDMAVKRFAFDSVLEIAETQLGFIVCIDNGLLEAVVDIGGRPFVLELSTACDFRASWTASRPCDYLSFAVVAEALGFTAPAISNGLDLSLKGATFSYDFADKSLVFEAILADYPTKVFVSSMVQAGIRYAIVMEVKDRPTRLIGKAWELGSFE
jgi:hypothetical protein